MPSAKKKISKPKRYSAQKRISKPELSQKKVDSKDRGKSGQVQKHTPTAKIKPSLQNL